MSFSAEEFTIDFGQWHEGDADAYLHTGIVMTPATAQEFAKTLAESVAAWRERRLRNGSDRLPETP